MNPLAGIRVKIPIKREIYKHTHTHTQKQYCPRQFFKWLLRYLHFSKKNATYR